jgi:membrane protein insertase Oxa1/YidC/SpoIIIJ
MPKVDLYPYNYWILYASIALLVIFIIMLLMKLAELPKAIKTYDPTFKSIERNLKLMQIKTEAMEEKRKEDEKKNKIFKLLLPILTAIYTIYRTHDDYNGVKGFGEAAKTYLRQQSDDKKLAERLKKIW